MGNKRQRFFRVVFVLLAFLAFCVHTVSAKGKDALCYCDGKPILMADPCVYASNGTYYLTGTSTTDKGFEFYTSKDLKHWKYGGMLYEAKGEVYKGATCFWAPEVKVYKGKFYLTFSCYSPMYQGLITCLAVSSRPDGDYQDLYVPWIDPKYSAIDCDIFVDHSEEPYLFYSHNFTKDGVATGQVYAARLKDDLSNLASEPLLISVASQNWERVNWEKNRCNEGPWVIRHKDKYVMTYSANDTGYEHYGIGLSEADSPLGPWKKYDDNPLLATDLTQGVSSPGHNSIVEGFDRKLYIAYHRHADPMCKKPNWDRVVCIERVKFSRKGKLRLVRK